MVYMKPNKALSLARIATLYTWLYLGSPGNEGYMQNPLSGRASAD